MSATGPSLAPEAPTRVRRLVFALACGISFLLYLHRYTWGFVKEDVRAKFGWDPLTLGWLDGLFTLSYGVGQLPAGIACDWCGAHLLLGSFVLAWSLALAGTVAATGLASMGVARLVFGAAQAGCYPVLNKVSKTWFPAGTRTTAQGWIATFFGRSGGAMSFLLLGTGLMGWLGMSWQEAVSVFALFGVAGALAFLLLFRNSPWEHPWANAAEAELITAGDPEAAVVSRSRLDWGRLARSRTVWLLFFRAFMSNLADVVFVYWFPTYLRGLMGMSPGQAGWLAALPILGGAVGGAVSGALQSAILRRTGNRRWARSGVGLAGKGIAAVLMLTSLAADEPVVVAEIFFAAKFFGDWEQPAEWGTVSDIAGGNAATVFACVNTVGSFAGFVGSLMTGWILDRFTVNEVITAAGWHTLFAIVALEFALAAVAWLFIDCRQTLTPPSSE